MLKKGLLITMAALLLSCSMTTATYAATGWSQENGTWYYYKNDNKQTGWVKVKGTWYYMDGNGVMKTGWQNIGGKWYMFRSDGAMHTGWWNDNGTWYYLTLDGSMLANDYTPDRRWTNADGSWTDSKKYPYYDEEYIDRLAKYFVNWSTDNHALGSRGGTNDYKIISALLGRCETDILNQKEKAVYDVVKDFILKEIKDSDSEYDMVVKITKFIWEKGSYSFDGESPYGLLIEGKGICDDYARTFKLMANAVGLECYDVNSAEHAWNIVRVDGEWYNADTTETASGKQSKDAKYVLCCDSEYARSSFKVTKDTPDCTATKYTKSNID